MNIMATMDPAQMRANAGRASALMRALANENRLMILCQLVPGERSVGDLAEALELRQAAVSQQLALLRKDGLVAPRRDGQTVYYALAGDAARRVLDVLYELFCAP